MKHVLTSASVLALSAAPLLAQDESPYQLPTLTLYANSTPFELGRTGTSVSVLTERDLDDSPETTLADTLDTLPGVNVVSNGGPGTRSAVHAGAPFGATMPDCHAIRSGGFAAGQTVGETRHGH